MEKREKLWEMKGPVPNASPEKRQQLITDKSPRQSEPRSPFSPAWSTPSSQARSGQRGRRGLLGRPDGEGFPVQVLQALSSSLYTECHNRPDQWPLKKHKHKLRRWLDLLSVRAVVSACPALRRQTRTDSGAGGRSTTSTQQAEARLPHVRPSTKSQFN